MKQHQPSIKTTQRREMKDKMWIAALFIEIVCVLIFPVYTFIEFYDMKTDIEQVQNYSFSNYYYFLFLIPLFMAFLTYLYLGLLCALKDHLYQVFMFINIVGLVIYSLILVICAGIYGLLVSAFSVGLFALWFFCFKRNLKLAALTTKVALEIFSSIKGRLLAIISKITLVFGALLAFTTIASLMLKDLDNFYRETKVDVDLKILYSILSLSSLGLLFFIGTCQAVLYLFGAALFDQKSLQDDSSSSRKAGQIERPESGKESFQFLSQAEDIAFRSSLGVACFGSVILSIIRLLRMMAEDASRNDDGSANIGSMILKTLLSCIEEIVEYLTSSAYIYSALYGTSLIESGKMGWKSYKNKGWDRYFSFSIVESVLSVTSFIFCLGVCLGVAFVSTAVTIGVSFNNLTDADRAKLILISILSLGLLIAMSAICFFTNQLVGGASTCQLSVYVEDPQRFENTYAECSKFKTYLGDENE